MGEVDQEPKKQRTTNFAKYTGIAFQMLITIGLLTFIGYKIDEYRGGDQLIFTAVFGLVSAIISLYQVIRSLKKD